MRLNKYERAYEKKVAWVWSQFTGKQKLKVRKEIGAGNFDQAEPSCCLIGIPFPKYRGGSLEQFTRRKYSVRQDNITSGVYHANVYKIGIGGDYNEANRIIKAYVKTH